MSEKNDKPEERMMKMRKIDTTSLDFLLSLSDGSRRRILEAMGQSTMAFEREMINPADTDELVIMKMFFLPEDVKYGLRQLLSHDDGGSVLKRIYNNVKDPEVINIASEVSSEDETAKIIIPEKNTFDLGAQYKRSLDSLNLFGILEDGDTPPPTLEEVATAMTPEVSGRISRLHEPLLLLVPNNSLSAKLDAINNRTTEAKVDYKINTQLIAMSPSASDSDEISDWKACVVEGARSIPEDDADDTSAMVFERMQKIPSVELLDFDTFVMFIMACSEVGVSTDKNVYTFISSSDSQGDQKLYFAIRYNNQVVIKKSNLDGVNANTRFRKVINLNI